MIAFWGRVSNLSASRSDEMERRVALPLVQVGRLPSRGFMSPLCCGQRSPLTRRRCLFLLFLKLESGAPGRTPSVGFGRSLTVQLLSIFVISHGFTRGHGCYHGANSFCLLGLTSGQFVSLCGTNSS